MTDSTQQTDKLTSEDKNLAKKIAILTQAIDRVYPPLHTLMFRSFIQGIFVSLGTTIGLSIVLGLLTFFLTQLQIIPGVKDVIKQTHIEEVIPDKE